MIVYIHRNPQKHGFVNDFREYPHSSYHSHLADKATKLNRKEVISWFGDKNQYFNLHQLNIPPNNLKDIYLEFD